MATQLVPKATATATTQLAALALQCSILTVFDAASNGRLISNTDLLTDTWKIASFRCPKVLFCFKWLAPLGWEFGWPRNNCAIYYSHLLEPPLGGSSLRRITLESHLGFSESTKHKKRENTRALSRTGGFSHFLTKISNLWLEFIT